MKLMLPVVILVAVVAFIAGIGVKDSFVSPFNASVDTAEEASQSGQMANEQAGVNAVSDSAEAAANPGTKHSKHGNSYTSQNLEDKVVMNGLYKLSTYNVNFSITLPKNGGDISGKLTGTCEGTITGKAEKPDGNSESTFKGEYSGDCKPIPTLGFKTHASGTFTGTATFKENKAQVTVLNKEPFETGGNWFEMFF